MYEVPTARRTKRKYTRDLVKRSQKVRTLLEKEHDWFESLPEEDRDKATNFEHEDVKINKRTLKLVNLQSEMIYIIKMLTRMNVSIKTPFLANGDNQESATV